MSHYISKEQLGKKFQLKINDFKEAQYFEVDDEGIKNILPRDTNLYIIRSVSTRMENGDYMFFRTADLKIEIELRRIR